MKPKENLIVDVVKYYCDEIKYHDNQIKELRLLMTAAMLNYKKNLENDSDYRCHEAGSIWTEVKRNKDDQ